MCGLKSGPKINLSVWIFDMGDDAAAISAPDLLSETIIPPRQGMREHSDQNWLIIQLNGAYLQNMGHQPSAIDLQGRNRINLL